MDNDPEQRKTEADVEADSARADSREPGEANVGRIAEDAAMDAGETGAERRARADTESGGAA